MIFFLKKSLMFFTLFFFLLILMDFLISSKLIKSGYKDFESWNSLLNGEIKDDIVIFGSSRAYVHFDPQLIEYYTGEEVYNLGWNAANSDQVIHKIDWFLENISFLPKKIIISLDISMFREGKVKNPIDFYPFVYFHPSFFIDSFEKGYFSNSDLIPYLRYKGYPKFFNIGMGLTSNYSKRINKGYFKIEKDWDNDLNNFEDASFCKVIFEEGRAIQLRNKALKLAKMGIEIEFIIPPYYPKYFEHCPNSKLISFRISSIFNIPQFNFIDSSNLKEFDDVSYFYDYSHLNSNGVDKYMELIFGL